MKFRKKPVVIDAIHLTGFDETQGIHDFFAGFLDWQVVDDGLNIKTLEGVMHADVGDWIIKGVKGEFYPLQARHFPSNLRTGLGQGSVSK